jgi:hypothetical protein
MPMLIADHHLKNFDEWFKLFTSNPPPPLGNWRLLRGTDDPNRVYVIGEVDESEVDGVNEWAATERMKNVFSQVDEMSEVPLEFVWVKDQTPG